MTVKINVKCPYCGSKEVSKNGFSLSGKQRYRCYNEQCKKSSFILDYTNKGYLPEIKKKVINMSLNGSGIRDISRVLSISTWLVMNEIKKGLQI
jgi:transposase-like protein